MGRLKDRYWLSGPGRDLADEYSHRIRHCISDFVSSVTSKQGFLESRQLAEDVLAEMVEAQETLKEHHRDDWH